MGETRAGKYGRYLAGWVNHTIASIPKNQRKVYRARFIEELNKYSFKTRRNGQARNSGCVYELESVERSGVDNPEDLAKLVKEGIHLLYQKRTAAKVMGSLLDNL